MKWAHGRPQRLRRYWMLATVRMNVTNARVKGAIPINWNADGFKWEDNSDRPSYWPSSDVLKNSPGYSHWGWRTGIANAEPDNAGTKADCVFASDPTNFKKFVYWTGTSNAHKKDNTKYVTVSGDAGVVAWADGQCHFQLDWICELTGGCGCCGVGWGGFWWWWQGGGGGGGGTTPPRPPPPPPPPPHHTWQVPPPPGLTPLTLRNPHHSNKPRPPSATPPARLSRSRLHH